MGIIAVISVLVNVIIIVGVLASFKATMTLPGIAALVLTVGMAVDSNILVFERMREESKRGKTCGLPFRRATKGLFRLS